MRSKKTANASLQLDLFSFDSQSTDKPETVEKKTKTKAQVQKDEKIVVLTKPAEPVIKKEAPAGAIPAPSVTTTEVLPSPQVSTTGITAAVAPKGFHLTASRTLSRNWIDRAKDNIAAITLSRKINNEGRKATLAEQEILSRYIAFSAGALANKIFPIGEDMDEKWKDQLDSLSAKTSKTELDSIKRATQYAHFTPEPVVNAIWQCVVNHGFPGGEILEAGCGSGMFMMTMPESIRKYSTFTGIENDEATARIAQLLQPEDRIIRADYTIWMPPQGAFDLAIGNPPFANRQVRSQDNQKLPLSLHTYFIRKSMMALKPGCLGIFVVSRWLMDRSDSQQRAALNDVAEFLGAVRMPAGALRQGNDTEVVADIIMLRRRSENSQASQNEEWLNASQVTLKDSVGEEHKVTMNDWLFNRPEMVLGTNAIVSSQNGPTYSCLDSESLTKTSGFRTALTNRICQQIDMIFHPISNVTTSSCMGTDDENTSLPQKEEIPKITASKSEEQAETQEPVISAESPFEIPLPGNLMPMAEASGSLPAIPSPEPQEIPEVVTESTERKETLLDISLKVGTAAEEAELKENSYVMYEGALHQIINRMPVKVRAREKNVPGRFKKHIALIEQLIPIRDLTKGIIRKQSQGLESESLQKELGTVWRQFIKANGPINRTKISITQNEKTGKEVIITRYPNLSPFLDDPDAHLTASIEIYDIETDIAEPGPIFSKTILHPAITPKIENAHDALSVVLDSTGRLDINVIASLANISPEKAIEDLGNRIYPDPQSPDGYILDEEALSGDVKKRLKLTAERCATDERFRPLMEALEAVQPPDLGPSDITARIGAPWIEPQTIMEFVKEVMEIETTIWHNREMNVWEVNLSPFRGMATATSVWGTDRRHAGLLLTDALNSNTPQIYDTEYYNGGRRQVLNTVATEAAQERINKIREAFENWIWNNSERAVQIARIYNDKFNTTIDRKFNGSHLTLPGKNETIILRDLQKNGVWRVIATGDTYLAHCVGAGKTFTIASATMEQKRLGLVSRSMLIVPNHCLMQFARDFITLYPNAKILVADETNFTKDKRQRFVARMTMNDWDAIIMSHDAFKLIPAPAKFEQKVIEEAIQHLEEISKKLSTESRVTRKVLEAQKEKLKGQLEAATKRKDDMMHIGETGVDQIIVDEAHAYRKLQFNTNQSQLKGVDPVGSQRAWDLYIKARYLRSEGCGNRHLILASGTPITNTLAEMFTIMRYHIEERLIELGINHFDAWVASFGEARTQMELQPHGTYKPVTRLNQFVNVADLLSLFRSTTDVIQKKDLKQEVTLPNITGGERKIIVCEPSNMFKGYQKYLGRRIKEIEKRTGMPQKGDDILLTVINDGLHASIDLRLVGIKIEEPNNKLNHVLRKNLEIYRRHYNDTFINPKTKRPYPKKGAAQMIFCDKGTEAALKKRGFSVYTWLKESLIANGVPAEEICFIQHYKTSTARDRIFRMVNEGRIRFILGSTPTMGTGANAQQRLKALHHIDIPWLVSDIEQREGRIERQGNQYQDIEIYGYATAGSTDANQWQRLEQKASFISTAMSGDKSVRKMEDIGNNVAQFAQAKALASGDERLKEKGDLEAKYARLQRLYAAHIDNNFAVASRLSYRKNTISNLRKTRVALLEAEGEMNSFDHDLPVFFDNTGREYSSANENIGDFAKIISESLDDFDVFEASTERTVGKLGSFTISTKVRVSTGWNDQQIPGISKQIVISYGLWSSEFSSKAKGKSLTNQIVDEILKVNSDLDYNTNNITEVQKQLESYENFKEQPFAEMDEMLQTKSRLAEIEKELNQTKDTTEEDDTDPAVKAMIDQISIIHDVDDEDDQSPDRSKDDGDDNDPSSETPDSERDDELENTDA